MKMRKSECLMIFLILAALLSTLGGPFARPAALAGPSAPLLGSAESFAVLAGSTVTNTGATTVSGDLGVSPGTAVDGFPPGLVTGGTIHAGDAVAAQAQSDVTTAYNDLAGRECNTDLSGHNLGGRTLTAGVYCFSSSAQLTGGLVLDAEGDSSAVFIFQIGSTLTTASDSSVRMINGGNPCNVFWQVGSSATLGTGTAFVGNILALTSITLDTDASLLYGRALARNGAVTMDTNEVSNVVCLSALTPSPTVTGAASSTVYPPVPWHDPICSGDKQRYTLSFANNTTETLTNVWLVDTLDDVCPERCDVCAWAAGNWWDDCSPGAIYDGQRTVRWFFPSVAPGQRIDVYLEVRLWTSVPEGVFENCLTVTSDQLPAETACSQVNVLRCPVVTPGPSLTPTPTRNIGEILCYDSLPQEVLIYRIAAADFRGYASDDASASALISVTSPPAPAGWNQPSFTPDSSWQAGIQVWWDEWIAPRWAPFPGATIVGLADAQGRQEGLDGTTHLIRHTFQLDAPQPGMRITSAILQMWSDNKTAWWWQGALVADDREGNNRQDELFPGHIAADGGTYVLAIQNSNDYQHVENPQGTAFRLCVTWARIGDLTMTPPTPTATATPTPTPAMTPMPVELCYASAPAEALMYRIAAADFRGYASDAAGDSALISVTSPPAPAGWNQPSFTPDSSWQAGIQVWWDEWAAPGWRTFPGAIIVGLADAQGRQEGLDGTTHLIRHTFQLDAPQPGMRITSAILQMWSDNKTAWWWQGALVMDDHQGSGGQVDLFPGQLAADGGTYVLAIQNSNDYMHVENPQGTAFRLCVTWARLEDLTVTPTPTVTATPTATPTLTATATPQRVLLPLVMISHQ